MRTWGRRNPQISVNIFSPYCPRRRIAGKSELAPLRAGLLLFITDQVLKGVDPTDRGPGALLLARAKAAENAMQGEAMIEERVPR